MSKFQIKVPFSKKEWMKGSLHACRDDGTCQYCALGFLNNAMGWDQDYSQIEKTFGKGFRSKVIRINDASKYKTFKETVAHLRPVFASKNLRIVVKP